MTTPYITVARLKEELKAQQAASASVTIEDLRVWRYILQASDRLDKIFAGESVFAPVVDTRDYPLIASNVNSWMNTFQIPDPLLSLSGVTLNGATLTVGTDVEAYPANARTPFRLLRLKNRTRDWYSYCSDSADPPLITVSGIFGYRRRYADAWLKTTKLAANLTIDGTTATFEDVDGTDAWGFAPWISTGSLLKIGSEFMLTTGTNAALNTGRLLRAFNGSTAAAHSTGDDVYVFQVDDSVQRAMRQAAFMYARRGAFEASVVSEVGTTITFPQDILAEVYGIVDDISYG